MCNTKLYSVLIVSLNQDFVSKIKQKLQRKGYNTYSFESKEKYEDFIKYFKEMIISIFVITTIFNT